ncbi:transposase [Streptomyces sp. NPDC002917]|uniref:transposase n=1 Tax=Streptomyces sp. NPDC002917 TaxID=3364671 RepID=UPI0036822E75
MVTVWELVDTVFSGLSRCTGRGRGATIKSVAEDLGVNTETLQNWIRADDAVGVARDARADAVRSAAECAVDAAQSVGVAEGERIVVAVGAAVECLRVTRGEERVNEDEPAGVQRPAGRLPAQVRS